jgi:hypothetical protein
MKNNKYKFKKYQTKIKQLYNHIGGIICEGHHQLDHSCKQSLRNDFEFNYNITNDTFSKGTQYTIVFKREMNSNHTTSRKKLAQVL